MTVAPADDLDWLAFRYVAGELDADEARTFEQRLEGELSAQDALCRAVALSERLVMLQPASIMVATRGRWLSTIMERAAWAGLGAAAAALLFLLLGWPTPADRPTPTIKIIETAPPNATPDPEVWARVRTQGDWSAEVADWLDQAATHVPQPVPATPAVPPWFLIAPSPSKGSEKP